MGSSEGQGLRCGNFLGKMTLFASIPMTYSRCGKSLIKKFRKENSGGRGVGHLKNFFFRNLTSNLQKQACSLCQFFEILHQNFILIFKSCSFICALLQGWRNFLPFLTTKLRELIPFSKVLRNTRVCREADDCYPSCNFASLPHFDN